MVLSCAAFGCKERFVKGGPITFHSFPKNEERRKLWEKQLRRENFKASKFSKICSKHFTNECFDKMKFGGRWLKNEAVPTLFNFPDHLQIKNEVNEARLNEDKLIENTTEGSPGELKSSEKRKRLFYLGDFADHDVISPSEAVKVLHIAKEQSSNLKKKVKQLHRKNQTLRKCVTSLNEMLDFKSKNMPSDAASAVLGVRSPSSTIDVIKNGIEFDRNKTSAESKQVPDTCLMPAKRISDFIDAENRMIVDLDGLTNATIKANELCERKLQIEEERNKLYHERNEILISIVNSLLEKK